MRTQSKSEELTARLETLIKGYRRLRELQLPLHRDRFEKLLGGFRASLKAAAQEEQHDRASQDVKVEADEQERRRASVTRLLSGFRERRAAWAEEQRESADDFNLFEVMEVAEDEVCHSKLLAWLLDRRIERGTHAQGNLGFRLFLQELEKDLDPESKRTMTAYADKPYWVRREASGTESRVDIEIAARKGFIIHVENKIRSGELPGQTNREWKDLQDRAEELGIPAANRHAIFLTLDGSKPENDKFQPVAWDRIAQVLEEFAQRARAPEVSLFARHYAAAVRKLAVSEPKAKEIEDAQAVV